MNEATKQKIRQALLGHKISEVTKLKISLAKSGCEGYWTGKYRTEETKQKISKSMSGRKLSEEHSRNIRLGKQRNS